MKKIATLLMVTLCSIVFTSCQKDAIKNDINEKGMIHFVLKTSEASKTFLEYDGSKYVTKWNYGDQIGMIFGTEKKDAKITYSLSNTSADGPTAVFEGTATASTNGTFQAVNSPSSVEKFYGSDTLGFNVGSTSKYVQHPTKSSFDPSCDLLISKPCDYSADGSGTVIVDDLYFTRMLAVLRINLTGVYAQDQKITSLTITANDSKTILSGRAKVKPSTFTIFDWTVKKNYACAEYTDDAQKPQINTDGVFLFVNPQELSSGASFTIDAETDLYYISKTITLTNKFVLSAGNISIINIGIEEANCVSKTAPVAFPYNETFANTIGKFEIQDISKPSGLSSIWTAETSDIKASAYYSSSNNEAESWLISPKIDLKGVSSGAMLVFEHCISYLNTDAFNTHIKLFIRTYTGDTPGEWAELAINTCPTTTTFVKNTTDLYSYLGKEVQIAFKYISTTATTPTWKLKNFAVSTPVTTITFGSSSYTIAVGDSESIAATCNSPAVITYSSNAESVATIDATGKITAISAGECTITASVAECHGFPANSTTCKVIVTNSKITTLDFSFNKAADGWPTSASDTSAGNYTYTISSTNYTFALTNNIYCTSGYLMVKATQKIGLPAISGKKLVSVTIKNSGGCSTTTKVKITNASGDVVTGGAEKTFSTTSSTYAYSLSGTAANTSYYIAVSEKNCQITSISLSYEDSDD